MAKKETKKEKELAVRHLLGLSPQDDYFKLSVLAEVFGLSTNALRSWVRRGFLKAKKIGGLYFVRKSDLEKFLNSSDLEAFLSDDEHDE